MGVVDAIVVGQLAPKELAHQALGWTINGPALIGGIGLLFGVQVLTARAVGAGRSQDAGTIWRRGLVIAVGSGLLVCAVTWAAGARLLIACGIAPELAQPSAAVARVLALSIPLHLLFMASTNFLEALQRPVPCAVAMWAANAVNLILNLAFVPSGGAIGSAWATVCSRLFLAAAIVGYLLTVPSLRPLLARVAGAQRAGFAALLTIGAAAALSSMVEAGAFATMGIIAGRIGPTAVATFAIATGSIVTLVYLLAQGLATAAAVLVAHAIGRGEPDTARRVAWSALGLTTLAMAACGIGCFLFATSVARAFTADAAVAATLAAVMGLIALLMTPDGGQGVADSVLRARGDNWFPTVARMLPFVFVAPPLAFWLSEHAGRGIAGIVEALLTASFVAYAALLARMALRHY